VPAAVVLPCITWLRAYRMREYLGVRAGSMGSRREAAWRVMSSWASVDWGSTQPLAPSRSSSGGHPQLAPNCVPSPPCPLVCALQFDLMAGLAVAFTIVPQR